MANAYATCSKAPEAATHDKGSLFVSRHPTPAHAGMLRPLP